MLLVTLAFVTCKKGEKVAPQSPETLVTPAIINVSGENSLPSSVRLTWVGLDKDGWIEAYEVSYTGVNWFRTEKTDSTFLFDIPEGSQYTSIEFKVRAIDNEGLKDPTPAITNVPIKNTPPEIEINEGFSSKDTAYLVTSVYWSASDPDGDENLKHVEIRANNGNWVSIPRQYEGVVLVPSSQRSDGVTSASLFVDKSSQLPEILEGLIIGDTNQIFVRSVDNSGSTSELDTITGLFIKKKSSDLLLIGGDRSENSFYREMVGKAYPAGYDFIDFATDAGKWQPALWDPIFTLLVKQYDKLVFVSDKTQYLNSNTNKQSYLIESSARSVQDYLIDGGKTLTIGFLQVDSTISPSSPIFGAYPIKSLSYSDGLPRMTRGSKTVTGQQTGYPDMEPDFLSTGVLPFTPSDDAEIIYKAQLQGIGGWTGSDVVAARRKIGGATNQVFIGLFLPDFRSQTAELDQLFDQILNKEFQ